MMDYVCRRCNYDGKKKSNLIGHLKRKKICTAKDDEHKHLTQEELLNEIENKAKEPKTYYCEHCDTGFDYLNNKYRHYKTCRNKIIADNNKNEIINKLQKSLDETNAKLDKVTAKLEKISSEQNTSLQTGNTIQNANTINNNNNNNITNNNNINNYYDVNKLSFSKDLFSLEEQIKLIKEAADDPITFGMSAYHREKYFNVNRKELQCIKLTPDLLQKNKIGIYNGQYWEEKDLHKLLPQITDEAGKFVGVILYDSKTAFQIDRMKNMEIRCRVDNLVLDQTSEEESNQILDKMTDDFVKYTEQIHNN
jgi:hypothetical protein